MGRPFLQPNGFFGNAFSLGSLKNQRDTLLWRRRDFMLPKAHNFPFEAVQCLIDLGISCPVAAKLRFPIRLVRFWRSVTTHAAVPKTAINENGQPEAIEDKIRAARQSLSLFLPSRDAHPAHPAPQLGFWSRVKRMNSPHDTGSRLLRYGVRHGRSTASSPLFSPR